MSLTRLIALLGITAFLGGLAVGQQVLPETATAEQQLLQKYRDWEAAVVKGDYSHFASDAMDDYTCVGRFGELLDKQSCLAGLTSSSIQLWKCDERRVRFYGNTAIVTGRVTIQGTFDRQDTSGVFRCTETHILQNGKWRLAASQFTRIVPAESQAAQK